MGLEELRVIWEQYYAYVLIGAGLLIALLLGSSGAAARRRRDADDGGTEVHIHVRPRRSERSGR